MPATRGVNRSAARPAMNSPTGPYRRNTVILWIASFMGLLLVYGLNTWLPQIMRAADYRSGPGEGLLALQPRGEVDPVVLGDRPGLVAAALGEQELRGLRQGNATTTVMTGYHVGAVLTAALAIWIVTQLSWHAMFIAGALPADRGGQAAAQAHAGQEAQDPEHGDRVGERHGQGQQGEESCRP
jgi:hypothetical protein